MHVLWISVHWTHQTHLVGSPTFAQERFSSEMECLKMQCAFKWRQQKHSYQWHRLHSQSHPLSTDSSTPAFRKLFNYRIFAITLLPSHNHWTERYATLANYEIRRSSAFNRRVYTSTFSPATYHSTMQFQNKIFTIKTKVTYKTITCISCEGSAPCGSWGS